MQPDRLLMSNTSCLQLSQGAYLSSKQFQASGDRGAGVEILPLEAGRMGPSLAHQGRKQRRSESLKALTMERSYLLYRQCNGKFAHV